VIEALNSVSGTP